MVEHSRIAVFGLEDALAAQFQDALAEQRPTIFSEPFRSVSDCLRSIVRTKPNVVFCLAEPSFYKPLLEALRKFSSRLPVIVVSRCPEVPEWLDAMDAGASDYCSAPFEAREIGWILENVLKYSAQAAA